MTDETNNPFAKTAMHGSRRYLRALVIPRGSDRDADGRSFGDDHMLADLGRSNDDAQVYLTTDYVHTSELADDALQPVVDADECGRFLASAGNFWLGGSNAIASRVEEAYFALLVIVFVVRLANNPERLRRIPSSVHEAEEAIRDICAPGLDTLVDVAVSDLREATIREVGARPSQDAYDQLKVERDRAVDQFEQVAKALRSAGWYGSGFDSGLAWLNAKLAEANRNDTELLVIRSKLSLLRDKTGSYNPNDEDDDYWIPGVDDEGVARCIECDETIDLDDPRNEGRFERDVDDPTVVRCALCVSKVAFETALDEHAAEGGDDNGGSV